MVLTLCLPICLCAAAQIEEEDTVRYNQYGVAVDRKELRSEARNNILVFESKERDYKLWFDNRVQIDGATYFGKNNSDYDQIGNGVSVERCRFAIKCQVLKDWYGEVDVDFANGAFELKDAIIEYSGIKNMAWKVGNFKEDFSMETTTTSRYLPFIERPMVCKALTPSRHVGIQGEYLRDHFRASLGMFFQSIGGSEEVTNVQDNNKDYGRSQGYSFTGKAGWMPYTRDRREGFYLGVKGSYRTPKTDVAPGEYGGVRLSTRNSTTINRKKYLDTDVIPDVDHEWLYGVESAAYYGPLRVQGEYVADHVTAKANSYNFGGWYAMAGCMLFGGKQRFNVAEGEFTAPQRGRKWGDIELLVRYDYLDLNSRDIYGGSGENFTAGINFYVNNAVKFVLNYQYSNNDRYANGKGKLTIGHDAAGKPTTDFKKAVEAKGEGGVSYHMLALRCEIDF
ncbi:MAG: OprO/OprP family phosphate-selective porin [Prevotella sp.]